MLDKVVKFNFDDDCLNAFNRLKKELILAPIMVAPYWSLHFELMCDASDFALGVVLGQGKYRKLHVIYYTSRTLNDAQLNYATTEKELLAVVFAFDKILFLSFRFQGDHVYGPFCNQVLTSKERCQTLFDSMSVATTRI